MRTAEDIQRCDLLFFRSGAAIASGLEVGINTKLHRVLHHMGDYFLAFGCIRRGETDSNETQHLGIKQSYIATNHEFLTFNRQLIKIRTAAEVSLNPYLGEKIPDAPHLGARLLLDSDPLGNVDLNGYSEANEDCQRTRMRAMTWRIPMFQQMTRLICALSVALRCSSTSESWLLMYRIWFPTPRTFLPTSDSGRRENSLSSQ